MRSVIVIGIAAALVIAVLIYLRFSASMRPGIEQNERMTAAFAPDPNNRIVVVVRGWNKSELDRIVLDDLSAYELPESTARISARADGAYDIVFPNDIQPKLFFFLVNYIAYPKGFPLAGRTIGVVGHAKITAAFGPPDATLIGKSVDIYLPANDTEYDLVYARLDTGAAYEISFTDLIWRPTDDPRMPSTIVGL
ncbi:MAG: hypothetical protein ISS15_03845 [Alphaproteobacteria bacterium]|nr:hypothetical protein [Alphaproteobacteria bacterium]MBL6939252.1 hypothetical protein [Alphaproteobacteria bacterium]MBL7096768.1 hypothetical protein [Alphaproteobacteria bacterium]